VFFFLFTLGREHRAITFREAFLIGACSVDISKDHRAFAQRYRMETEEGITAFIRDLPVIQGRKYAPGGYAIADVLLDFRTALDRADLTDTERAALRSGIVKATVLRKIAAVFREWKYDEN